MDHILSTFSHHNERVIDRFDSACRAMGLDTQTTNFYDQHAIIVSHDPKYTITIQSVFMMIEDKVDY